MLLCKKVFDSLLADTLDPYHRARVLAAEEKESGAWLSALPSSSIGTLLDNSTFRISIALRIGQPICQPHTRRKCKYI